MWYELSGFGRAPEDFRPAWDIEVTRYRKNEARQPRYTDDGDYAMCPVCPEGNVFVVRGFLGSKNDTTLRNNGNEPYLACIAEVKPRNDDSKEPFSVGRVVLACPACGYGYDVNKDREIAKTGLRLTSGD